jgi:hypothetical protein
VHGGTGCHDFNGLFCGHKGLALLAFLSGKGCQTAYMIDNTVDFFKNDFDMYLM